jgi:hypothetical protein
LNNLIYLGEKTAEMNADKIIGHDQLQEQIYLKNNKKTTT